MYCWTEMKYLLTVPLKAQPTQFIPWTVTIVAFLWIEFFQPPPSHPNIITCLFVLHWTVASYSFAYPGGHILFVILDRAS